MTTAGILVEGCAAPWGRQEMGAQLLIVTGNTKAAIPLHQLEFASRTPSPQIPDPQHSNSFDNMLQASRVSPTILPHPHRSTQCRV